MLTIIGSNWIVQKLIERDHINHHYRRLDGARSQLQLKGYTSHGSANFKGRLSKSSQDLSRSVGFENRLRNLERQMTSQFSLDVVIVDEKKKKDLFDEKQDVINRHSKYFTQPKQNFTPRLVRKVVRPVTAGKLSTTRSATPATQRPTTATLGSSSSGSSCLQQRRPLKAVYFPVNNHQHRNVSDDSAFDDGHYSSNDSVESSGSSEDLSAFNFQKWLKKQYVNRKSSCFSASFTFSDPIDHLQRGRELLHATYVRHNGRLTAKTPVHLRQHEGHHIYLHSQIPTKVLGSNAF